MSEEKEVRVKITLTLPESLIERAKIVGIRADRSVSAMVEKALRPVVEELERQYPSGGTGAKN